MQEHGMNVPAAMSWLEDFGKERVNQFLSDKKKLPSSGREIDSHVAKYIDGIGYLVRGTDAWSYESERYWGTNGLEIQHTRVVYIPQGDEQPNTQEGLVSTEELKAVVRAVTA